MEGACGGSRRQFLKATAATGAAAAAIGPVESLGAEKAIPDVKLGKTGQIVSRLGMGTSWDVAPSFVQLALARGVKYIDTAEGYESGNAERTLGEVLEQTGKRKDVYLVTKNSGYRQARGAGAAKIFEDRLNKSLERLQTDYVDSYSLQG